MYMRFSALLPVAVLAAVATAAPSELEARTGSTTSECNTGSLQCCNSTYTQTDPTLTPLLGLLGIVLPDITGLVGLSCTPITVVGTGTGTTCTQQPVCCTDNTFNGLINLGCSPVNLGV